MPVNDTNQTQNFVSPTSLRNYVVATGSLTLVINVILYVYSILNKGLVMPLLLLIPIALLLSILYIISFFKKEEGLTIPQYLWITCLNSLMLFTSISGVNGMLDTARKQFDAQNSHSQQSLLNSNHFAVQKASVGSFFKHLIFPTHGWFNTSEPIQNNATEIITSAITSIDTTKKMLDTLIKEKNGDINTITTLHKTIDTLRSRYINTLGLFQSAQSNIHMLQDQLKVNKIPESIPIEVTKVEPKIEIDKQVFQQQQQQQIQQLQRQQQQQQIQQLQLQQQQLQRQRLQLQQEKLRKSW